MTQAPRFSASVSLMFGELPFAARFAAAAEAGFEGVEIQRLDEASPQEIADAVAAAGVAVALVNVDMGDLPGGGLGLAGVPGREDRFARALDEAYEFAVRVQANCVHLGPSRVPPGMTREDCRTTYLANVARAAELGYATGIPPVIEAMNPRDVPDFLVASLDFAAAVICEVPGVGLLFDAYHVAKSGEDPAASFSAHRTIVHHVQVSDAPDRSPPGTGTIDWPTFFATLCAHGFAGWVGAEYASRTDTAATLHWLNPARQSVSAAPQQR